MKSFLTLSLFLQRRSLYTDIFNIYGSVNRKYISLYIQYEARLYSFIYIWKLLYMFRVVPPPIIRSA